MRKRVNLLKVCHGILSSSHLKYTAGVREFGIIYSVSYKEIVVWEHVEKKNFETIEDTERTDFEILKITKHVIVFVGAANIYMLNKYSKNNKTFTYNHSSFGIFPKESAEMVDNLLLCKYL